MTIAHTPWFRSICRLVLFTFTFATFHPATLGVPWSLDFRLYYSQDSGLWTLDSRLFSLTFGPSSAEGQTSQNVSPVANAGADQKIALGTEVSLNAKGSSDPDNGPQLLTYSWRLVAKPTSSHLTDADIMGSETVTPTCLPDVAGSYELRVEVFDGANRASDTVVVEAVAVQNVNTQVRVTSANERSTLDRATRQLTSTADITLTNISNTTILVPIALVFIPTADGVRMPEASGHMADGKPFYDVGTKAKIVELKPNTPPNPRIRS